MREVRPTLRVLRKLPSEFLPRDVSRLLARVDTATDSDTKLRCLKELRLYGLEVNLLADARTRFESGAPDRHRTATHKLDFPVYEVRDHTGQAWRGAVVLDESGDPWLVHAAPHDDFHRNAADQMHRIHAMGRLLPSSVDLRIREEEESALRDKERRVGLLGALLVGLEHALRSGGDTRIESPESLSAATQLSVALSGVPAHGWDATDAHQHADIVSMRLVLRTANQLERDWILATCIPFLQPDTSQVEAHYDSALTVSVLLTRARLVQLLARPDPWVPEPAPELYTVPSVLHYADPDNVTRAFVLGQAIRAVCGEWWVPTGDDSTHAELPICADCEAELPAAQALKDLLENA